MASISSDWQQQLSQAVTRFDELCALLDLDVEALSCQDAKVTQFPLKVPRSFIARMEKGNVLDPLLQQILPTQQEAVVMPGFDKDPLNEAAVNPIPGLLHKYHGRVLLLVSGACALHCRYCFRRHFPYEDNNPGSAGWQKALVYISEDKSIEEVIFSGGDPLVANDKTLSKLINAIADIPHVKYLRVHSRLPVTLPARVTEEFIHVLTQTRLQTVLVIHCNHPQEVNDEVIGALKALHRAGVMLLNQSLLLKNINDNADVLIALNRILFEGHVLPYYLHLLDPVAGSAHFYVDEQKAKKIMHILLKKLPGYLVPKLVREQAGCLSKVPVNLEEITCIQAN